MQLKFKYDLKKDTENFLKSFSSVNNKRPTKLQELYTKQIGKIDISKVPIFLKNQGIDIPPKLKEIETGWKIIEPKIISRMEQLFGIQLPAEITAYLSTNSRCTYNIQGNYFFVYIDSERPDGIIAHELLHFYTWYAFHIDLESKRISKEKYNDIKESLTELLNTDFKDLLGEYHDRGYSQHSKMRTKINKLRGEQRNVKEIIETLVS